jgi:hypothetical protein
MSQAWVDLVPPDRSIACCFLGSERKSTLGIRRHHGRTRVPASLRPFPTRCHGFGAAPGDRFLASEFRHDDVAGDHQCICRCWSCGSCGASGACRFEGPYAEHKSPGGEAAHHVPARARRMRGSPDHEFGAAVFSRPGQSVTPAQNKAHHTSTGCISNLGP